MRKNFFSTVAGATILISLLGIAAKGIGFMREIIFAGFFGLKSNFELFLIGAVLPSTINVALLYMGQNYFIPAFTNYKNKNPQKADVFLNKNIWMFFIAGLFISLILFASSQFIINGYLSNSPEELRITALYIFRIFLFTIPLNAVFSILTAYFHTELNFTYPAVAQLILNIFTIIFVVVFTHLWGIYSIPFGMLAGTVVQTGILLWAIRRKISFDFKEVFNDFLSSSNFTGSLGIIVLIELINQLHVVIDRYFISSVDQGGIAALNYANTVFLLPITIFSFALSSAIFPKITSLFNSGSIDELRLQYLKTLRVNSFVFVPISVVFILGGNLFVHIFYQRGSFNPYATQLTSELLKVFAISLVFYSAYSIINKLIFSAGLFKKMLFIAVSALAVKIVLNIFLVVRFKQNGLALSSVCCYILMAAMSYVAVAKKIKFGYTKKLFEALLIDVINAVFAYGISYLIYSVFLPVNMIGAALMIVLFAVIFITNAILLETEEIEVIRNIYISVTKRS